MNVSNDVLELYTFCGGFSQYELDNEMFGCLCPWDWLKEKNWEPRDDGVQFADHSMEVATWRLRYENPQQSSVWVYEDQCVAPTIEEFFRIYLDHFHGLSAGDWRSLSA